MVIKTFHNFVPLVIANRTIVEAEILREDYTFHYFYRDYGFALFLNKM